ncbi:uncharacterized protein [Dysidea avara]|uniref:uncharacterized protein n=1 Tax=Dysidea avara TaxID=196820 RepID=UPI00331EEE77
MPSVRSRIKQFESLTGEDEKSEDTGKANKPAKKFLYPGHASQQEQQRHSPIDHVISSQNVKQSGDQHHMSNRLEEVWSVRRNVGLGRNINPAPVTTTSHLTTNMYSRHGALPAHHQYLPSVVNKKDNGESSFGRSRSPLQDHNQDGGRLRNIKAGGYSYSDAKRSHDLPTYFDMSSSSSNKHKSIGLASMIRPNDNGLLPPVNQMNDKKRRYAEKMANAHLRSTGMGDYTPKGNTYAKLPPKGGNTDNYGEGPSSRWRLKSREDDEFDF